MRSASIPVATPQIDHRLVAYEDGQGGTNVPAIAKAFLEGRLDPGESRVDFALRIQLNSASPDP